MPGTHKSQREISETLGISQSSVSRVSRTCLGLTAYRKTKVQNLSDSDKQKRLVRGKRLLRMMTKANIRKTFFTDEKLFKMNHPRNTQNDRVYAVNKGDISLERLAVKRSTFPKNVMISVGVSKLGKTSVFFVEKGVKINSEYYRKELLDKMLPEMSTLSDGDYILLQDGARSHTAKASIAYLDENCPRYIKPDFWPPNSPDLNVLDFAVWGDFESKVWKNKPTDVESLKEAIKKEWAEYPQEILDNAIDSFKKRLRDIVKNEGGYIEHYKR